MPYEIASRTASYYSSVSLAFCLLLENSSTRLFTFRSQKFIRYKIEAISWYLHRLATSTPEIPTVLWMEYPFGFSSHTFFSIFDLLFLSDLVFLVGISG
jgi:hypothetical protein